MFSLANLLARNTWYWVVQWMRQPWMRRIHLFPMRAMNEGRRIRFYESYKNQNRLARRWGLVLLKWSFVALLASIFLQLTYYLALTMSEKGWLTPPQLEKQRLTDE